MDKLLQDYAIVFWDFDGVIKESVEVKTQAFQKLFVPFGAEVVEKVRKHHTDNGGMSRFKKFPIYLQWAGVPDTQENVDDYCDRFAKLVEDDVVGCDWVPGAKQIVTNNTTGAPYILVTATPQDEILRILDRLSIRECFSGIFGAPVSKAEGIQRSLEKYGIAPTDALMIGDSRADYEAAKKCGTLFLLRRTPENLISMPDYDGPWINNFTEYAQ